MWRSAAGVARAYWLCAFRNGTAPHTQKGSTGAQPRHGRRQARPSSHDIPIPPRLKANTAAVCILLFLLVVGVFLPSIGNGFINHDDPMYVCANRHVQQGLSTESIRWAFTTFDGGFWHPLTWLSLMLDFQWSGLRAGGFHCTSLVLRALSTMLLFSLSGP